jgi:hypothetical protein
MACVVSGPAGRRTVLADAVVADLVPALLDALGTRAGGDQIVPAFSGALARGGGWVDLAAALERPGAEAAWSEATQALLAGLYSRVGAGGDPAAFRRAVAGAWALRELSPR